MSNTKIGRALWFPLVGLVGIFAVPGYCAKSQSVQTPLSTQRLAFEVATVRPSIPGSTNEDWDSGNGRLAVRGYSLRKLIRAAFNLKSDAQIVGGPDWLDKRRFDISAKISDEQMAAFKRGNSDRDEVTGTRMMLQTLLSERFHLEVEHAEKKLPMFALVVSGKKIRLRPDAEKSRNFSIHGGQMVAVATSMEDLAESLTRMREVGDRVVVDRTGLTGTYDFELNWTPDRGAGIPAEAANPGLFTALQEQLGLRLKPEEGAVPVIEVVAAEVPNFD